MRPKLICIFCGSGVLAPPTLIGIPAPLTLQLFFLSLMSCTGAVTTLKGGRFAAKAQMQISFVRGGWLAKNNSS